MFSSKLCKAATIRCSYAAYRLPAFSTKVDKQTENFGEVVLETWSGADERIAVYGLNRPNARNALGYEMVASMRAATEKLKKDPNISVVIVRSLVPGIFCAGADLKERYEMSNDKAKEFVRGLRKTFADIEDLPMPTIAAIDGAAMGGGLELALACDIRVAADNTKLGLVETSRGLLPGAGGTQRLPRLINLNIAKELMYTARIISGKVAKELGVVNHSVPQNEANDAAFEKALELAREIVPNAPIALRMVKRAIDEGIEQSLKEGYEVEQKYYEIIVPTKDRQEGMLSFIQKRKPVYKGQ